MLLKAFSSAGGRALLISSLAFGLYVICPRMSAMMVQQAKARDVSIYAVIPLGALISIPLFIVLSSILLRFGMAWAVLFAAVGDVAAAALFGLIDPKAGVELAIITVFVYVGIRVAPLLSGVFLP